MLAEKQGMACYHGPKEKEKAFYRVSSSEDGAEAMPAKGVTGEVYHHVHQGVAKVRCFFRSSQHDLRRGFERCLQEEEYYGLSLGKINVHKIA